MDLDHGFLQVGLYAYCLQSLDKQFQDNSLCQTGVVEADLTLLNEARLSVFPETSQKLKRKRVNGYVLLDISTAFSDFCYDTRFLFQAGVLPSA